jgi:pectate lyase
VIGPTRRRLLVAAVLSGLALSACPLPGGTVASPTPDPVASPSPAPSPSPSALPSVHGAPDPADKPDGWAGSTGAPAAPGGFGATAANTYVVTSRAEFLNALRCGGSATSDAPKIIYASGMIDLCVDASGNAIDGFGFIQGAGLAGTYPSYEAYRSAYAASCATGAASTLAATRTTLYNAQKAVVIIDIGSNTSILGMGAGSGFKNGNLKVDGKTNVVLRNLSILDAFDYFTEWDPSENLFNSQYDNLSVTNDATYVWVDHCRLGDGDRSDSSLPTVMVSGIGKKWVCHDGLLDVTNGASWVTVSWNIIENHDKTMLIGSSDSRTADAGRLKVTVHHNSFAGVNQRLPRVRFGQVHVYDNAYSAVGSYSIGVGDNARIWSENNIFSSSGTSIAAYDDAVNQGYVWDAGSTNVNAAMLDSAALVGWDPAAAYAYSAEPVAGLAAALSAGAGVGKF